VYTDKLLAEHGIQFEHKQEQLNSIRWHSLRFNNNTIEKGTLTIGYPPKIVLDNIEITTIPEHNQTIRAERSQNRWLQLPTIFVHNMALHLENLPPIEKLHGELSPLIHLQNDHLKINFINGYYQIVGDLPLEEDHISGDLQFSISTATSEVKITLKNAILQHPLLGMKIEFPTINMEGQWNNNTVQLTLNSAVFKADISGLLNIEEQQIDLHLNGRVPFVNIVELFNLAESKEDIDIRGDFLVDVHVTSLPFNWKASIDTEDLSLYGHLFSIQDLRNGALSYQPINANNSRLIGPASPHWTPQYLLGWMPAAAIAAEDSQFWNHNGINIDGIQMAIDAIAMGEEHPPGGSSITQQLAKNIFVGNKRTLKRKVQELLYALSLETHLSKHEIITLYLNAVEFGPNIYGIKAAANTYFLKLQQV